MKPIRFRESPDEAEREYLYKVRDTGETVGVLMTIDELMERESSGFLTLPDGREAKRAIIDEAEKDGLIPKSDHVRTRAKWPMVSYSSGVNPDQADELREFWREHDVRGCEVAPNGDVIYADRAARRSDHQARGLYDRSGGYGDAMPKNL